MPEKPIINIVFIGHVDVGKSSLIGRIFVATGAIKESTMKKIEEEAKMMGKEHAKFAWVMDKLKDERDSDQTTDVAYSSFELEKTSFTVIDAPGHQDFVRNMITGASQADAAVLVVSAAPGQYEAGMKQFDPKKGEVGGQTREHATLAYLLGIQQLVIAINKMDAANFDQNRYGEIKNGITNLLKSIGYTNPERFPFVPISAFQGENISTRSSKMPWYSGTNLLEVFENLKEASKPLDKPLRMPIFRVFKVRGAGLIPAGTIKTGKIKIGDKIIFEPTGATATVRAIEMFHKQIEIALAGDNVGLGLTDLKGEIVKGCVAGNISYPPSVTQRFQARIVVSGHPSGIHKGYRPILYCHTETVGSCVDEIVAKLDTKAAQIIERNPPLLMNGEAGIVWITTEKPIVLEKADNFPQLSRFALRDLGKTVAVGLCVEVEPFKDTEKQT